MSYQSPFAHLSIFSLQENFIVLILLWVAEMKIVGKEFISRLMKP